MRKPTPPPLRERDAVFLRVGRNIANFQRLEAVLRAMLPVLSGAATRSGRLPTQPINGKKVSKASLGDLSAALQRALYDTIEIQSHEATEVISSFEFKIEAPDEFVKAAKKRWHELARDRNKLVHNTLATSDLSSPDECNKLAELLDEQNLRIHRAFDELYELDRNRLKAATLLEGLLASDEIWDLLQQAENGA